MVLIVWREHYGKPTVEHLTRMGTLPRYETEVEVWDGIRGDDVAANIADRAHKEDASWFREGGKLTIVAPEEFAGDYDIQVDWDPSFSASPADD